MADRLPFNGPVDFNSTVTSAGNIAITAGTLDVQNGGAVTQGTSKSTGVTLNTHSGEITMHNAELGAQTAVTFTVTCSVAEAQDVAIVNHVSTGVGSYIITPNNFTAGSFDITVTNGTAGALSQALVLRYVLIKGANS